MVHHAKKEHIDILVVIIFACLFFVTLPVIFFIAKKTVATVNSVKQQLVATSSASIFNKEAFADIEIEGKAFVVYDVVYNDVLAGNNETKILPLASLTKVMTALSATMHNSKQDTVVIQPRNIDGGYDLGLKKGQTWSLSELLKYMLVFSSNDGAEAVADTFGGKENFLLQMNTDAQSLGLNFVFTDPTGLDNNGKVGGLGSALDTAKLFGVARARVPEILDATTKKRQTVIASGGRISGVPNTNQEIENFPGAVASKTGYTDLAGGNLGVVVDVTIGRPVVIIVLGSTREGRFRDVSILYKALQKSLEVNSQ